MNSGALHRGSSDCGDCDNRIRPARVQRRCEGVLVPRGSERRIHIRLLHDHGPERRSWRILAVVKKELQAADGRRGCAGDTLGLPDPGQEVHPKHNVLADELRLCAGQLVRTDAQSLEHLAQIRGHGNAALVDGTVHEDLLGSLIQHGTLAQLRVAPPRRKEQRVVRRRAEDPKREVGVLVQRANGYVPHRLQLAEVSNRRHSDPIPVDALNEHPGRGVVPEPPRAVEDVGGRFANEHEVHQLLAAVPEAADHGRAGVVRVLADALEAT
mmetsp:Transcript_86566/g.242474  ORF Transcript_86566/g.242474 Transcript_86566/m.242474 type:complete len:269 (-) Transcript_86566:1085-1891(-)